MDKGGERREVYQLTKTENGEQKDGIYGILKRVKTENEDTQTNLKFKKNKK